MRKPLGTLHVPEYTLYPCVEWGKRDLCGDPNHTVRVGQDKHRGEPPSVVFRDTILDHMQRIWKYPFLESSANIVLKQSFGGNLLIVELEPVANRSNFELETGPTGWQSIPWYPDKGTL